MIITIYYSKLTGEIYTVVRAENEYGYERFGTFAQEMEQVLDIMYIENNDYFFNSYRNYKVVNGQLILKEEANTINIIEE